MLGKKIRKLRQGHAKKKMSQEPNKGLEVDSRESLHT